MHKIVAALIFLGAANMATAEPLTGKLKICRMPGIVGLMDGKKFEFPAGTYTGACDKNGEHCRDIRVRADGGELGPQKSACAVVNASTVEEDGKPIKVGDELRPQWSMAGFEPVIKVSADFK